MSRFLLLAALLVRPLAGCVPGSARSDGAPIAETPFTLTALDVGQSTSPFRGRGPASRARLQHGAVLP